MHRCTNIYGTWSLTLICSFGICFPTNMQNLPICIIYMFPLDNKQAYRILLSSFSSNHAVNKFSNSFSGTSYPW
jgi:hypothetical protein